MIKITKILAAGIVAAAGLVAHGTTPADAQAFYKGKTVKVIVGFGPGGGYDAYARLLGRHIGNHIAGKPRIIVQNMPGAGSLKAVEFLRTKAPKDGTTFITFNFGQITRAFVIPHKKFKVNFKNFSWIGSMNRDVSVCYLWNRFKATNLAEAATVGRVNFGLTSAGSASYFNQSMLKGIFGVKLKQVSGYRGSKSKQLAIERGELDGDCGAWGSVPIAWLNEKKITVLLRYSTHRPHDMPTNIPFAGDVAKNAEEKKIIALLTAASDIGRPYITRREVPVDRVKILRRAFNATMKDAAFIADAKRQRRAISPMTAKEVVTALKVVYTAQKSIIKKAKKILIKKKN
jgi:tripartite-type tricarboxylate transporter receptor subunit TctC